MNRAHPASDDTHFDPGLFTLPDSQDEGRTDIPERWQPGYDLSKLDKPALPEHLRRENALPQVGVPAKVPRPEMPDGSVVVTMVSETGWIQRLLAADVVEATIVRPPKGRPLYQIERDGSSQHLHVDLTSGFVFEPYEEGGDTGTLYWICRTRAGGPVPGPQRLR